MYTQSYWDFLIRLHEIWGMERKMVEIPLIIEERKALEDKTPTSNCLEHCGIGLNSTRCGGFVYNDGTGAMDKDKIKEYAKYLELLDIHKAEVRDNKKKKLKENKK